VPLGVSRALTLPQISSPFSSQLGLAGLDTTLLFWGYCKTLPKTRIDVTPAMVASGDDDRTEDVRFKEAVNGYWYREVVQYAEGLWFHPAG
jgi:hypothetical protein